jgi:hypothetical protein
MVPLVLLLGVPWVLLLLGVGVGKEVSLWSSTMLAQARRVVSLRWITIDRLPKKAPMPSLVEAYKSLYESVNVTGPGMKLA